MKKKWDLFLGRVTMYRLVFLVLAALSAVVFLFSLVGVLDYSVPQLAFSLAVCVISTLISSRLFSLLFRSHPHTESSLITAFLLFFLFRPTADSGGLSLLALTAVMATASKYLFAWRRRHIANPAAVGAVLITVLQLDASSWWMATDVLAPWVMLGAFVVVYRTRQGATAAVFVLLSTAAISSKLVFAGASLPEAVFTALTSYPIIFLAGFMLTEPLTLPPRRWQRLVIAALVALIFSYPLSLGPIYTSPEWALVIGNIVSFFFGQRRAVMLRLREKQSLTPTTTEFVFHTDKPVIFRPGQYVEVSLPHARVDGRGSRRVFSIASPPHPGGQLSSFSEKPILSFGTVMSENSSSFKKALAELGSSQPVRATLVSGDFVLPKNQNIPLLFVAGGIGITPFISQIRHLRAASESRDVVVIYSVKDPAEIAYRDEVWAPGIRVVLLCSTEPNFLPEGWTYGGSGHLSGSLLTRLVPDVSSRSVFISGSPGMVNDVRATVRRLGVRKVKTDYFSGY